MKEIKDNEFWNYIFGQLHCHYRHMIICMTRFKYSTRKKGEKFTLNKYKVYCSRIISRDVISSLIFQTKIKYIKW